jgi:hypothetical protein
MLLYRQLLVHPHEKIAVEKYKNERSLTCEKTEISRARMGALFSIPSVHPHQLGNHAGMAINRFGYADPLGAHRHGCHKP